MFFDEDGNMKEGAAGAMLAIFCLIMVIISIATMIGVILTN